MTKLPMISLYKRWFEAPLIYTDSEMIQIIFTPTKACLERILPPPLTPGLLGAAYLARFRNSAYGDFWESAIVVQCTYKEYWGVYCVTMHTDNVISLVAHREIWGFPSKPAKFRYQRKGNRIKAEVISDKVPLTKFNIKLEGQGEWIDTGDIINYKLIPRVDAKNYDVNQITAAPLKFVIHEGLAGEGQLSLGHTPDEPLDELFEFENIIAGTWFRIDLTTYPGKIIATVK